MTRTIQALAAGAAGAMTTTLLHQVTRRLTPDAPRVDFLGMQALTRVLHAAGLQAPTGSALYNLSLLGDIVSNSVYFALVGVGSRSGARQSGVALGAVAGLGAVYLPPYMGLSGRPTDRTAATKALTVALYTAGGMAAGLSYQALAPA